MPIGTFHDVTWGSARLWCSSLSSTGGRTQVVHELADGDDHPVQDRGLSPRRVTCELLFVEMPNVAGSPMDRFLAFKAQVDGGDRLVFSHPIDDPYYANVEDFSYDIDEDGNIEARCTFIKSGQVESPTGAGAGTSIAAGEDAIAARASEHDAELAAVGLESDIGTRAIAAQATWSDASIVPTRQVIVDVAGLSASLSSFIEDEDLENDLALWGAFKASIELGAAIRAAALAALAETPKLMAVRIGRPISLLALCVSTYGGAEAEDRVRQVLALNDITTPGWIAEGTILMMPVPVRAKAARRAA